MKLITKLTAGGLLALGAVFATGCAKDANETILEEGVGTRVVVKVDGIADRETKSEKKMSTNSSSPSLGSNATLIEGSAFDVFVSNTNGSASKSRKISSSKRNSSSNGLRAAAMEDGIGYRIFLRKEGATELVSEPFTSGETGSIPVEKGATYEWFALSYNTENAVPESDANGEVAVEEGEGLLYASGDFTVADEDGDVVVPLNVTFKPQLTKVTVELNTQGMFAPIASADVSVTGVYSAPESINILTGEFTGDAETALSLDYSDFEEVSGSEGTRTIATAYVAANVEEDITVSATNLTVTLDTDAPRNFGTNALTQTFGPEPGTEQQIVLNFLESPLTRGDVSWARSNLYYSAGFNPYRFYHTNPRTNDPNSYFSFKGHLPRQLASANEADQIDPCALVYPAGRWKTPTQTELGTLTNTQGLLSNVVGGLLATLGLGETQGMQFQTGEYVQLDPDANGGRPATEGQNPAYHENTNVLRFNYNGLMANIGVVEELINLELGSTYGAQAAFWTSESVTDANLGGLLGGALDLGAWSFVGRDVQPLLGTRKIYGTQSLGALNIDLLGSLNVVSSSLMNVRCTRDNSWDPLADGYNPDPTLN